MFKLRDYQQEAHDKTMAFIKHHDTKKKQTRMNTGVVVMPTGCHAKGTRIIMSDGRYKNVEDVKVGDKVMGVKSQHREVLRLCRGRETMYKITINKIKESFIVNENHVLHLVNTCDREVGPSNKKHMDVTVKEYLEWTNNRKNLYKMYCEGFELPEQELPFSPYYLGLWLGDGTANRPNVLTNCDKEIKDWLNEYCNNNDLSLYSKDKTLRLKYQKGKSNWLIDEMRLLNLRNNKHIPDIFKYNSRKNRLELLAGLVDTDGYTEQGRCCEIMQKNNKLSDDICYLLTSLGIPHYRRKKLSRATNSNQELTEYNRITFNLPDDIELKVERKKRIIKELTVNKTFNQFGFEIEKLEEDDFYGFELDGDHLYLTEHQVVMHNSGKSMVIAEIVKDYGKPILVICPSKEILEQNYNKYISYGFKASIYSASIGRKEIGEVTFATIGSIKSKALDFKKIGVDLVVIDEAHWNVNEKGGMFKTFLKQLNPKYIIGYTATPFRLVSKTDNTTGYRYSELIMLNRLKPVFFKKIIHVCQIKELVDKKFWADVTIEAHEFNTDKLIYNSTGAEFNDQSIIEAVKQNNVNNRIYKRIKQLLQEGKKSILVFLDSVENAQIMAKHLGDIAACVSGNTHVRDREDILNRFKKGEIKVVTNHSVLGTGFDFPELQTVIIGRPTNSLALFYQFFGRCIRPYKDKKALFIDYGGNIERFGDLRDLTIEELPSYGWTTFINDKLVTGVSLKKSKIMKKDILRTPDYKPSDVIFPFGKHKGKKVSQIPNYYLTWVIDNIDTLDPQLRDVIVRKLTYDEYHINIFKDIKENNRKNKKGSTD